MNNSKYIMPERKFHDAWAFLLYSLLTIITFTCTFIMKFDTNVFLPKDNEFNHLFNCSCVVLGFIIFNFLAYSLFPELYLKFTLCMFPVILISLALLSGNTITIVLAFLSLIVFGIFLYYFWARLKEISIILKTSVRLLIRNVFSILLGIFFYSVFSTCISLLLLLVENMDRSQKTIMYPLIILNIFWSLFNSLYFFRVYITSIVAYHIINPNDGVLTDSVKNSFYALGSISFAGLIVAIVRTLRFFVNKNRRNRDEDRNLFLDIIMCLLIVLLNIFEDIIQFINTFTMPYLAIHGESYMVSMRKSSEIITNSEQPILSGLSALNYSLFFSHILVTVICFGLILIQNANDLEKALRYIFFTLPPLIVYASAMMTISSSYLGLIYMNYDNPSLVKNSLPEFSAAIENLKN